MHALPNTPKLPANSLKVFRPMTQVATGKVRSLLDAGAQLVRESEDKVVLRRGIQQATVDAFGRVEWVAYVAVRARARLQKTRG